MIEIIEWKRLKEVLNYEAYKDFSEWMRGQTCVERGVYSNDFVRWLNGGEVID